MGNSTSNRKSKRYEELKCEIRDCEIVVTSRNSGIYCESHTCHQLKPQQSYSPHSHPRVCNNVKLSSREVCDKCKAVPLCSTPGCLNHGIVNYFENNEKKYLCSLKHKCDYCEKCVFDVDATTCTYHYIKY